MALDSGDAGELMVAREAQVIAKMGQCDLRKVMDNDVVGGCAPRRCWRRKRWPPEMGTTITTKNQWRSTRTYAHICNATAWGARQCSRASGTVRDGQWRCLASRKKMVVVTELKWGRGRGSGGDALGKKNRGGAY